MRNKRLSREARTRGPDLSEPLNKPTIETPGFSTPKTKRTRYDLLGEHREQMLSEAHELSIAGATLYEIAEHFGVSVHTIYSWRARDESFRFATRIIEEVANDRVAKSLYHKAIGYTYRSEKIVTRSLPDGGSEIVRVPILEHVPPDNTAMIFWLKNRQPDKWRDVQNHNVTATVEDKTADPRTLAMALLDIMREAIANGEQIDLPALPAEEKAE